MEHPTNKLALAVLMLGVAAAPASAQNYDELSRSDFISMSGGNAAQSNIAIQTPTPWPPYVNNTRIRSSARRGILALEQMYNSYKSEQQTPSTVINIGTPQ